MPSPWNLSVCSNWLRLSNVISPFASTIWPLPFACVAVARISLQLQKPRELPRGLHLRHARIGQQPVEIHAGELHVEIEGRILLGDFHIQRARSLPPPTVQLVSKSESSSGVYLKRPFQSSI